MLKLMRLDALQMAPQLPEPRRRIAAFPLLACATLDTPTTQAPNPRSWDPSVRLEEASEPKR